jgi:phosphoserine aminotransferase
MAKRVFNFNPGPAALPLDVLETVKADLPDYKGTGMSVMEISHRSKEFEEVNNSAMSLMREIMGLGDNYKVLFLGGGASTQFAMIPLNFLHSGRTAAYVETGSWSGKAIKEGKISGQVQIAASTKEVNFTRLPSLSDIKFPSDAAYLHMTSNETIHGNQFVDFPATGNVPLVCDMSSDFLSRRRDFGKFSLIYAGAQKNIGPAGVTAVIIREDMLAHCKDGLPTMLDYRTHAKNDSLYNTPPVFGIYIVGLVMEWVKKQGGLEAVEKVNCAKKDRIYGVMDAHPDYFKGTVDKGSRSWMNITMRLPSEELEAKFIAEAKSKGFVGLKGHRSVGGIRVSLYNAMTLEGANQLAEFMEAFKKAN